MDQNGFSQLVLDRAPLARALVVLSMRLDGMRLDDEQAIDELARALASQHPSFTEGWADYYAEESTHHVPTGEDLSFFRFITNVRRAGGWKPFVRAPRVSLIVLRSLCEKGRARPRSELAARLFALDKFIFWRVLAFWRTDRDLPHHITTREREPPQNEYFD